MCVHTATSAANKANTGTGRETTTVILPNSLPVRSARLLRLLHTRPTRYDAMTTL
jgi:hypothetical protein